MCDLFIILEEIDFASSADDNTPFISEATPENVMSFFFNWDSLHARLNSHYEAWSYKKKKHKKVQTYKKSV